MTFKENKKIKSLLIVFKDLWKLLSAKRKTHFFLLLFAMVMSALIEILSVASVIPFLSALTNNNINNLYIEFIIERVSSIYGSNTLLNVTILFVSITILSAGFRLLVLSMTTKLAFRIGTELSGGLYKKILAQEYEYHVMNNSAELINLISNRVNVVIYNIIMPILILVSAVIMMTIFFIVLSIINIYVAIGIILIFSVVYFLLVKLTKVKLFKNSLLISKESNQVIKSLQEGLNGIRDVILDNAIDFFCKIFISSDANLRRAQARNVFISQSPKYIIEPLGMILIAIVAFYISSRSNDGISEFIPIMGAIVLAAQRLLPIFQQGYNAWAAISGEQHALDTVINHFNLSPSSDINRNLSNLKLRDRIDLVNVSFKYHGSDKWIFKDISLSFIKGKKYGIIGRTGHGKSTLLDILMGLLLPTYGELRVDGVAIDRKNVSAWRKNICHVPQSIYLSDSSFCENIAFGENLNEINLSRVKAAAKIACIEEFIESEGDKYLTKIGENGIKLSGGQRQRLGIARALYKDFNLLVLDEATSSLDMHTELEVMRRIQELNPNITVIKIAHRLATLKDCDYILEVSNGSVSETKL